MSKTNIVTSDPIADMLSRVRNAIAVNSQQVSLPHSKIKETVAKILVDNGFLESIKTQEVNGHLQLVIAINQELAQPKITEIKRLSRPGRRVYVKAPAIPKIKQGRGIVVISTSSGIMTGQQAKANKLGGELICEVY